MSSNFFYNAYLNYFKLESSYEDNLKIQQTIGYYDIEKSIWFNAWSIYNLESEKIDIHKKSKELLVYGLNIENDLNSNSITDKMMIKSIICSSKIYITDGKNIKKKNINTSIELQIILSVICYLTKAKKIAHFIKDNIIIFTIEI